MKLIDKDALVAEIERLHREVYKSLVFNGQAKFALDRVVDFINSLPEEPVSEDRREAILKKAHELANRAELISDKFPKSTLIAVAIDMAEWCDSHPIEEPISEVLDEAAEDFAYREWDGLHDEDGGPLFTGDYIQYSFREGAKWQKQQMMKDAVDTEVTYGKSLAIPSLGYALDKKGLDYGDKVKVIIVKED